MKVRYIKTVLMITFLLLAITVDAQIEWPGEEEEPSFDDDVLDAPINGLIGLGLIVGSYFGYRKLKNDD